MNKDQANIIKHFYEQGEIYCSDFHKFGIDVNSELFDNLYTKLKLIKRGKLAIREGGKSADDIYISSFIISENGKEEYEKYCSAQNSELREIENLEIAKDANRIAKDANKKSDKSNRIATGSLITAIISAVIAIAAIVFSFLSFGS